MGKTLRWVVLAVVVFGAMQARGWAGSMLDGMLTTSGTHSSSTDPGLSGSTVTMGADGGINAASASGDISYNVAPGETLDTANFTLTLTGGSAHAKLEVGNGATLTTGSGAVTLSDNVASLDVSGTFNVGAGGIDNSGQIIISGSNGKLVLSNAGTVINRQTIIIDVDADVVGALALQNHGTLTIQNSNTVTIGNYTKSHSSSKITVANGSGISLATNGNGFADAFKDTVLAAGSSLTVTGGSYTGGDLAFTTAPADNTATVSLNLNANSTLGNGTDAINVGPATLQVNSGITFNGSVAAGDISVANGASANFMNGAVTTGAVSSVAGSRLIFSDAVAFSGTSIDTAGYMNVSVSPQNSADVNTNIFQKTTLTGPSAELSINAYENTTLSGGVQLAAAANTNQMVRLSGWNGSTLTLDGDVDVKSARLFVQTGRIVMDTTSARTISAGYLNVGSDATLATSGGGAGLNIATSSNIEIRGALDVGANDTLSLTTTTHLSLRDTTAIKLTDQGNVVMTGVTSFDYSGTPSVTVSGSNWSAGDAMLTFAATANGGGQIDEAYIAAHYNFGRTKWQIAGDAVVFNGRRLFADAGDLFGLDINENMQNGFAMLDTIEGSGVPGEADIVDYFDTALTGLGSPATRNASLIASGQGLGEYGALADVALDLAGDAFRAGLRRRMRDWLDDDFGFNTLASSPAGSGQAHASLACPAPAVSAWADLGGNWTRQRREDNLHGYKYNGYGVAAGLERRSDRLVYGVAGGYTRASVDVDRLRTKFHADVANVSLYAAYAHESGFFAQASAGFAHAWNDYDVNMVAASKKEGDFNSRSYSAGLDLGYAFRTPFVNAIPSVGVHYVHLRQDGWRESGGSAGSVGVFRKERRNSVDIPVLLRLNRVIDLGCARLAPEVRAGWTYAAKKSNSAIGYGLQGAPGYGYRVRGVDPGRSRYTLGAGLKARWRDNVEASVVYDFEWRSKYRNHALNVGVGVSF